VTTSPLHLVYRYAPGAGAKPRPTFFSKDSCLAAFLRTASAVDGADITFLHDGEATPERRRQLSEWGELIELPSVGNARSKRAALSLLELRRWSDDDLVYFAEDDYLFVPDAFKRLLHAAAADPNAQFFTLYDHPDYQRLALHRRFARRRGAGIVVDGTRWSQVRSTTMSFAARVGALRELSWAFWLGTRGSYPDDFGVFSGLQHTGPHLLLRAIAAGRSLRDIDIARSLAARLVRRDECQWRLIAPVPSLATHVEVDMLAAGVDWEAEARAADEWLLANPTRR
jgi:hypothetical protein